MTDELPTLDPGRDDASRSAPSLRVLHVHGSRDGTSVPLPAGTANLGRRDGMEIRFDPKADFLVSGLHARLVFKDAEQGWHVEDIGSTNGTFVNGTRVAGVHRLHTGDVVTLGAAGRADGAVAMKIDIEGEAAPPVLETMQEVTPSAAPGDGDPEEGDHLFGRMKRGFQRFKDRREVRKRLDEDRRRLPGLEAAAKNSCAALGRAMWDEGLVGRGQLASETGLDPFGDRFDALRSELASLQEGLEKARDDFTASGETWSAAHAALEVTSQQLRADAESLAEQRDAAIAAVVEAYADRFDALKEARTNIVELLGQTGRPEAGLDARMGKLAERLRQAADACGRPLDGADDLFATRARLEEEAADAATKAREAGEAVGASTAQRAREQTALEAEEQRVRDAEATHEQDVEKLREEFTDAFAALGGEAVESPDESIEALDTFSPARAAVTARTECEEHIAEARAALEELGG